MKSKLLLSSMILILYSISSVKSQNTSIANHWNEQLIKSIRKDFARPPVHARNLFHLSIAMYDAWAAYDPSKATYFLGKTHGSFTASFTGVPIPSDIVSARKKAISYAAYRLIKHRFANAPGVTVIYNNINHQMDSLGYDINYTSIDYVNGGPAALGNYIANRIIAFGYQDGSNEINNYAYQYYQPVNPKILVEQPGNPTMVDPNRWQNISLSVAIDQAGNVLTSDPPHLGPEWGNVKPFALHDSVLTMHTRNGNDFKVYHDQNDPAYIDTVTSSGLADFYKWNFSMVSVWQSMLDTTDGVMWDVSPASQGNVSSLPNNWSDYSSFYDFYNGGDAGQGHALNPITNQPYAPQIVKRGDYARVLAEFWADGLDSETPPGHWFEIYNHVSDDPLFVKKWAGQGAVLDDLEYDVKAYLTMGGAMHDAAIAAWGHKGWYDYVRPVSAIRYMADHGQSSDTSLANYSPKGIPLIPGLIEVVQVGDTLAGTSNENVGKIKLYTWRGPTYITNPLTDMSGVGWILAERWWPYQRPTFVTPPFAGYVSGHSTFSRAAAEIMTSITGSEYFPGGMSNFVATKNEFLKFEEGPSETIILQWATYRDASDQCSLSRIWGGIHPPVDDIAGRKIGIKIGDHSYQKADILFTENRPIVTAVNSSIPLINIGSIGDTLHLTFTYEEDMDTTINPVLTFLNTYHPLINTLAVINGVWADARNFVTSYSISSYSETLKNVSIQIKGARNLSGKLQNPFVAANPFIIDKQSPFVTSYQLSSNLVNDSICSGNFSIKLNFNEKCDPDFVPTIQFFGDTNINGCLTLNTVLSGWINDSTYLSVYGASDNDEILDSIGVMISNGIDLAGNTQLIYNDSNVFAVDTRNVLLSSYSVSDNLLTVSDIGSQALIINLIFDKPMNQSLSPQLVFSNPNLIGNVLTINASNTEWIDSIHCVLTYNLQNVIHEENEIGVQFSSLKDRAGNSPSTIGIDSLFSIDTKKPIIVSSVPNTTIISDLTVGTGQFSANIVYDEKMDTQQLPVLELYQNGVIMNSVTYNIFSSTWINDTIFKASFNVNDMNEEINSIDLKINFGKDFSGNAQVLNSLNSWVSLDTKNPEILVLTANNYMINSSSPDFELIGVFNEAIDNNNVPLFDFVASQNIANFLSVDSTNSGWINSTTYRSVYTFPNTTFMEPQIDIIPSNIYDMAGNSMVPNTFNNFFGINYDPLSVRAIKTIEDIMIYPNPILSGGRLSIVSAKEKIEQVLIYSTDGKLLFDKNLSNSSNTLQSFEIPDLSAGMYILVSKNNTAQKEWKLLVRD